MKRKNSASILHNIIKIANTVEEDDVNDVLVHLTLPDEDDVETLEKAVDPTDDKEEMGEIYNEVLGYNPITHFTENDVRSKVRLFNKQCMGALKDEDLIVEDTMDELEANNHSTIWNTMMSVIKIHQPELDTDDYDDDDDAFDDTGADDDIFEAIDEESIDDDDDFDYDESSDSDYFHDDSEEL